MDQGGIIIKPDKLTDWEQKHRPDENLLWKGGFREQISFVSNVISGILAKDSDELEQISSQIEVISTHRSKSVKLPVYCLKLKDGTTFVMRDNFYDWKISVITLKSVNTNFVELFNPEKVIHAVYCEGFPEDLVFGSYSQNSRQFTIELKDNYQVYMFFWIFAYGFLGKKRTT